MINAYNKLIPTITFSDSLWKLKGLLSQFMNINNRLYRWLGPYQSL